jgi:flagellar protein FliO/FliZ
VPKRHTFIIAIMSTLVGLLLAGTGSAATEAAPAAPMAIDTGSMLAPLVRMVLSLGAVLAVVAALAWLARRLRGAAAQRGSLIEIVSALPLGTREKVLLLRVGEEQVLVGISPAGMRALHVIKAAAPAEAFSTIMNSKP